jgi:hypothetical protein
MPIILEKDQTIKEAEMKTRKAIFVLLMVGCLAAFSAMAANAAISWVICTIDQVGPSGTTEATSGSRIFLTAVTPANAWVGSKECRIYPSANRGNEFLATALTAVSSGQKVKVSVNPAVSLPYLGAIYIQK